MTQKEWLSALKAELTSARGSTTWDELASIAGVAPRALKTYRMPETSKDYRQLDEEKKLEIRARVNEFISHARGNEASPERALLQALAALVVRQARISLIEGRMVAGVSRRSGMLFGLTPEDRRAMALVSRVLLKNGLPDSASEIHQLLYQCTLPLGQWLDVEEVRRLGLTDSSLIYPESAVPTEECIELANGFSSLTASIEERLFERFVEAINTFTKTSAAIYYTEVREFVVRNPICDAAQLNDLAKRIPAKLWMMVQHDFYEPLPETWKTKSPFCAICNNLMVSEGSGVICRTKACANGHPPSPAAQSKKPDDCLRVKRGIMQYWVEPGFDEIQLFDRLKSAGLAPILYPDCDRVDISVGSIGIDLKAYRSPETLGMHFERSLGGLAYFDTKMVVIPDWIVNMVPSYIERVTACAYRSNIRFLSVSSAFARLVEGLANA